MIAIEVHYEKKTFKTTYTKDFELLKESLYAPKLPIIKVIQIGWLFYILILGIQTLITGRIDNFYDACDLYLAFTVLPVIVSKLTKSDDLKEIEKNAKKTYEIIETIDEKELHKTYPTLNIEESFPLDSFQRIVKTTNMLHIYVKNNELKGWTTIYRHNIEGGSEDDLVNFLFSKCKNIKKKKVINLWVERVCIICTLIILIIKTTISIGKIIDIIKIILLI